jgi:hypothetical protein
MSRRVGNPPIFRAGAKIQRHAWKAHGMAFSAEEALAVMLRFELGEHEVRRRPAQVGGGCALDS